MGGEDFSRYGQAGVPIVMYRLGAVDKERLARFKELACRRRRCIRRLYYPDAEPALATGIVSMSSVVLELLKK